MAKKTTCSASQVPLPNQSSPVPEAVDDSAPTSPSHQFADTAEDDLRSREIGAPDLATTQTIAESQEQDAQVVPEVSTPTQDSETLTTPPTSYARAVFP